MNYSRFQGFRPSQLPILTEIYENNVTKVCISDKIKKNMNKSVEIMRFFSFVCDETGEG